MLLNEFFQLLPCLYLASPRGFSQWYTPLSSDPISSDTTSHIYQRKELIAGEESVAMLVIQDIEKSDEGIYHCETTNGIGEGKGTVQVNVVPKPHIVVRPSSLANPMPSNSNSQTSKKITCEVELACEHLEDCPEALFDWQFNDRKIRSLVTRNAPLKVTASEREVNDYWKSDDMRTSRWILGPSTTQKPKEKKSKRIRQISQIEVTPAFASANIGRFSCNSIYGSGSSELPEPKMITTSPTQLKVLEVKNTYVKLSWKQPANQKRRGFGNVCFLPL